MRVAYVADTGVFVRCGGPENEKFQRLRHALRGAGTALIIPQRVYEELGGEPEAGEYPSSDIPYGVGIDEGWIDVFSELDYSNPMVSTAMDQSQRFLANATDRPEDHIEKADTALVGLAAQLLESDMTERVVLLTTDKPAGRAAVAVLHRLGFDERVEYRYVSEKYLESITPADFQSLRIANRRTYRGRPVSPHHS